MWWWVVVVVVVVVVVGVEVVVVGVVVVVGFQMGEGNHVYYAIAERFSIGMWFPPLPQQIIRVEYLRYFSFHVLKMWKHTVLNTFFLSACG